MRRKNRGKKARKRTRKTTTGEQDEQRTKTRSMKRGGEGRVEKEDE